MKDKLTERDSHYDHLESMATEELLQSINKEDQKVAMVVAELIPAITALVEIISTKIALGGRLFYIGAGTSGRLGILDASECPPTFGIEHGVVIGLIAGGDSAIRKAVEFAEDEVLGGWHDLQKFNVSKKDVVIGIAASGSTPYVVGALEQCRKQGIITSCITCNSNSALALHADHPLVALVGPEFVTGSTRMKAGTAQKLILNMISTATMIRLGRVKGNKMVDMQLANNKLVERGKNMIVAAAGVSPKEAEKLLSMHGSVREVLKVLEQK